MYTLVTVLIIITATLLGIVVLIQNSKGGGLAAGLSSSNQVMGVKKTSDLIEKITWGLVITLIVFCLAANFAIPRGGESRQGGSAIQEQIDNAAAPQQQAPQQQQQAAPAQSAPASTPAPQPKK